MHTKIRLLTDKIELLAQKNLSDQDHKAKIGLFFQSRFFKHMPHISCMTIHYGMVNPEQQRFYSWQTESGSKSELSPAASSLLGRVIRRDNFKGMCVEVKQSSTSKVKWFITLDDGILQDIVIPASAVEKLAEKFKKGEVHREWGAKCNTYNNAEDRGRRFADIVEKLAKAHPEFHIINATQPLRGMDFSRIVIVEKGKTLLDDLLSSYTRPGNAVLTECISNWLYFCEKYAGDEQKQKAFMLGTEIESSSGARLMGIKRSLSDYTSIVYGYTNSSDYNVAHYNSYESVNASVPGVSYVLALSTAAKFLTEREMQAVAATVSQSTRRALIDCALF